MAKLAPDFVGEPFLIAGGKRVPCEVPVIGWKASGFAFTGLRRRRVTDLVVGHWTGGEGDAAQLHRVLRGKKPPLSVHFFVDDSGAVYQFCDADMVCGHAKGMNDRGCGIELQNRSDDNPAGPPPRQLLREVIRGVERVYTAFTAEQMHSYLALCKALCEHYKLPFDVPRLPNGDVNPNELTPAELAAFRGCLAHYHWSPAGKQDHGLAPLRAIVALGQAAKGLRVQGPAE